MSAPVATLAATRYRSRPTPSGTAATAGRYVPAIQSRRAATPWAARSAARCRSPWRDSGRSEAPGWHTSFVTAHDGAPDLPESLQGDLQRAAEQAAQGVAALRDWIAGTYLPAVAAVPDGVGRERYLVAARVATGADIDPEGAYAWGWTELGRIEDEMVVEAERVLPGATPAQALAHLEEHGPAVEGVEEVRGWLQALMDRTIADLDGTVVDIAEPVKRVEAM